MQTDGLWDVEGSGTGESTDFVREQRCVVPSVWQWEKEMMKVGNYRFVYEVGQTIINSC